MDQVKIGKFIAQLRRDAGLTQEALGQRIGVSNKTVSRWENGNYIPDIEMFQILSEEFQVSIHELLAGARLSDEDFLKEAEENGNAQSAQDIFSFEERKAYYKQKWRRDHVGLLFVLLFFVPLMFLLLSIVFENPIFAGLAPLAAVVAYGYQNNQMMIYVEHKLYD